MSADDAMEEYAVTGAATAFERLYDALAPRLLAYLGRRTRDLAHAEDLLQQCFLQIHRARGCFVRGSKVAPWAFAAGARGHCGGRRRGMVADAAAEPPAAGMIAAA